MKNLPEDYWFPLVAGIVAGLCVLGIAVIAIREKRRTGRYPRAITGGRNEYGWFALVSWLWLWGRIWEWIPESAARKFPLFIIVPGISLALTLGFVALTGFAFSHTFRREWNWRWGLWYLLFPAFGLLALERDLKSLASMPWAWIPAALVGIGLTPFVARLAYVEFYVRRTGGEANEEQAAHSRIWRPGGPR